MNLPRIGICVVTYNSARLVEELVASLKQGAAGTDWSLIIADNDSSDHTVDEVRRCAPSASVIETGANLGYAAGVNAAVNAAGEQDAYLILNADVRLAPGCVATLVGTLTGNVGIAVPRLNDAHGKLIWSMRREPTVLRAWAEAFGGVERVGRWRSLGEVNTNAQDYRSARCTDWAEGSTQLLSAACWRACGPWDESFFLYSEETDFNLRAGEQGFAIRYEPSAVATHLEGASGTSPRQQSLLVVNRVRLFKRSHGTPATVVFWLALLAREASRALLGNPASRTAMRDLLNPRRLRQRPSVAWLAD